MSYGIGYMGSKNQIAKHIMEVLPKGERFVDLFAGGCSMTHCAMMSGKYERFLINDLNPKIVNLFVDAINGKYANETRWISREDFYNTDDIYIKTCWSFGNGLHTYMYGKQIEQYKKGIWHSVVFDDWTLLSTLCPSVVQATKEALQGMPMSTWKERKERRLKFGQALVNEVKRQNMSWEDIQKNPLYKSIPQSLESLQSLQRLERLERLQSLQSLYNPDVLSISSKSYDEYQHEEGDVVYCDPPYAGTQVKYYGWEFDHAHFWSWVRTRDYPVYVSEYNAPSDFVVVWSKIKPRMAGGGNSAKNGNFALEKLFLHKKFCQ